MANVARTSYMFISSLQATTANVSGPNLKNVSCDFVLNIPSGVLTCEPHEFLRLTLVQAWIPSQLYNVQTGQNTVIWAGNIQDIPPGNWNVYDLVALVNTWNPGLQVAYNARTNKMEFTNTTGFETAATFHPMLGYLFGVLPDMTQYPRKSPQLLIDLAGETQVVYDNGSVGELQQVQIKVNNELVLHLQGVTMGPQVNLYNMRLDNEQQSHLQSSDVLAVIPMTAPPGYLNYYENVCESMSVDVHTSDQQLFGIQVTDTFNNLLWDMPHWSCVIKAEVFQRPNLRQEKLLETIAEYQRLHLMQEHIQRLK